MALPCWWDSKKARNLNYYLGDKQFCLELGLLRNGWGGCKVIHWGMNIPNTEYSFNPCRIFLKKQGNRNFPNFRNLFCWLKINEIFLFAWLQLSWTALHERKLMAATSKASPLCSAIAWERGKKKKCNFRSIFQKAEWTIFSLALGNSPIKCLINDK